VWWRWSSWSRSLVVPAVVAVVAVVAAHRVPSSAVVANAVPALAIPSRSATRRPGSRHSERHEPELCRRHLVVRPSGPKIRERVGGIDQLAGLFLDDRHLQILSELGSFFRIEKITTVAQDVIGRHQLEACLR
jgi:hypothetical protein